MPDRTRHPKSAARRPDPQAAAPSQDAPEDRARPDRSSHGSICHPMWSNNVSRRPRPARRAYRSVDSMSSLLPHHGCQERPQREFRAWLPQPFKLEKRKPGVFGKCPYRIGAEDMMVVDEELFTSLTLEGRRLPVRQLDIEEAVGTEIAAAARQHCDRIDHVFQHLIKGDDVISSQLIQLHEIAAQG